MKTVIYKIENLLNSDCYIGSTTNYSRRTKRHFEDLKLNKHHSIKLQRAVNKYGVENFRVYILESFEFISKDWKVTYFNKAFYPDNFADYDIDYSYYISKAREWIIAIEDKNQLNLFT